MNENPIILGATPAIIDTDGIEPLRIPAAAWEIMDDAQKDRAREVANESHNGVIQFVEGKIPEALINQIMRDQHRRAMAPSRARFYDALKEYQTEKPTGKAAARRLRQMEKARG